MSMTPSAAPQSSLRIWTTSLGDLFVEIPGLAGRPPYIERLPCDSRGIGLLLGILGAHRTDDDYSAPLPIPSAYRSNHIPTIGTETQGALADRALRLAGLLK